MDIVKEPIQIGGESPDEQYEGATGIVVHDVEDLEVSHRTKDKVHHHHHHHEPHKHKTQINMEDDDEEQDEGAGGGVAIPDYGGEDIDEEDDEGDYGSSEGGHSAFEQRMQEIYDEINERTNNITAEQLE